MTSPAVAYQQQVYDAIPYAVAMLKAKKAHALSLPKWADIAHEGQLPPEGEWRTWYIRGGRGGGKTRAGAEWLAEQARTRPGIYAIVAPTYATARDVCVEDPKSGLLAVLGGMVKSWNRSIGDIRLTNGSVIFIDGADDGARTIEGKNLSGLWADEIGLWKRWKLAWEQAIRYAVRMPGARIMATGTPKRGHGLVKLLMEDDRVVKTLVTTEQNKANLDAELIAELMDLYGGTVLGRQELGGEVLNDSDKAMWHRGLIHWANGHMPRTMDAKTHELVPDMSRIVVAIDPAVSHKPESDETGIVVAGKGRDGRAYVLEDLSLKASPGGWASAAVAAYHRWNADRIVAEVNNGGEMVEHTIRTVDENVPVTSVHASQGKRTRAEPIVGLYEKERVWHADPLPELEDQMCNWEPENDPDSPDRLDALVWALTSLMLTGYHGNTDTSWIA